MKKNVLALSITAAVMGLGLAGGAQAMVTVGGAAATNLVVNTDGIGQILLVPYYTAQGSNATMLNLVNTDLVNGKAVKVRFRGASNSDDVFDFQVFLSPGDVWAASIQNKNGVASLTTNDASCTKPTKAVLNATPFLTARLDPAATVAQRSAGTLEGYVEIFNMADIPPTAASFVSATNLTGVNPLFTATKHVNSVAPCSGNVWDNLDKANLLDLAAANATGMSAPTTGLMGNWTIINLAASNTYGGAAVAIEARDVTGKASTGNVVYWPQTQDPVGTPAAYTADPLLAQGVVAAAFYDLPDLSTPYVTASTTPAVQAAAVSGSIATSSVMNEFYTNSVVKAKTDWVFSMPTRRYSVAMNYVTGARQYTALTPSYFDISNTLVSNRQICVTKVVPAVFNREELTPTNVKEVVVSPSFLLPDTFLCGEVSVTSINNGAPTGDFLVSPVLQGTVARNNIDTPAGYVEGWIKIATPGATATGLPVLGSSFIRADSGSAMFGSNTTHRYTR